MKIVLDLSKLVEQGKLSAAEAERLRGLAAADTGSFAINLLVGFGVVAVSAGVAALVPRPETALMLGLAMFAIGLGLTLWGRERWSLLAQICVVVGALMFCGGVLTIGKGGLAAMLIVAAALAGASIVARSSLLMAAAVLALGACLGAQAGYWHATYMLAIYEPLLTIVLFSLLGLGAYHLSKSLSADYERLALIAARTSVFMVNFGFWIGSLWGDRLLLIRGLLRGRGESPVHDSPLRRLFQLWCSSSAGRSHCWGPASGLPGPTGVGLSTSPRCSPRSISTRNGSRSWGWSRSRWSSAAC
jgi:iron complex transport system permease protein